LITLFWWRGWPTLERRERESDRDRAADIGSALAALVGTAVAGALWLALAFRSMKLRDDGSPDYVGLYRWTGEQVRTRARAVAFVVVLACTVVVANLFVSGWGAEQHVDEAFGGGLGLVVGQAGLLVGLDDLVVGGVDGRNHEVEPQHRDADGLRRGHGDGGQMGVQLVGDVVDGATGVEIGRAPYRQYGPLGKDAVELEPCGPNHLGGPLV